MRRIKFNKYSCLGLYFVIIQILVFIRNYLSKDYITFFYYCDHIALLLAIAFFLRNIPLIKAFISIGLISQLIYATDFISSFFFNKQLTGTTAYLSNYSTLALIITLFMHLGTTFVALAFTFKEKNKKNSLIYAFLYTSFLYFITILFTPKEYDVNCVYNVCGKTYFYFDGFTTYWIILVFVFLIIPTYYFQELLYYISSKRKQKETLKL